MRTRGIANQALRSLHALTGVLSVVVMLATVGCAADTTEAEDIATAPATLHNVQHMVFDGACATGGCHSADVQAGGIDLSTEDATFEALVDVPAYNDVAYENGWTLVAPGDSERSFLCRKLKLPGLGEGAPMPPGQHRLSDEAIELVEAWVLAGAPR